MADELLPTPGADEGTWGTELNEYLSGDAAGSLNARLSNTYAPLPKPGPNPLTGKYHADGYGATGDGLTDDTAAIQSAIDDVLAADDQGGVVLVPGPNVTYRVEGTLEVGRRVTLEVDMGARVKRDTATTGPVVRLGANNARLDGSGRVQSDVALADGVVHIGPPTTGIVQWCRIGSNITIAGPGETVAGSIGLKLTNTSGTFQNVVGACEINNCETGVLCDFGANANEFHGVQLWNIGTYAFRMLAGQWRIIGGFLHSSETGVTVLKAEGCFNGRAIGLSAEPGVGSTGYDIDSGCNGVQLIGVGFNTDSIGTDAGTDTLVIDRRAVTGPSLTGLAARGAFPVEARGVGDPQAGVALGVA